jgi:hypothetical protein
MASRKIDTITAQKKAVTRKKALATASSKTANKLGGGNRKSKSSSQPIGWTRYTELTEGSSMFPMNMAHKYISADTESHLVTLRLASDSSITSDGSGLIQTVLNNNPANAQAWSVYGIAFDAYRVLAMIITFEPLHVVGGSSATFYAPIASVVDRTDAIALTSYALAERYGSHKKAPGMTRFTNQLNMLSIDESVFVPCNSPVSNSWIKFYSSGNSASTTVGRLDIRYIVQFRGLGIN